MQNNCVAMAQARLHVILARDASVGVVIRRGPAKHVATILWDRESDTFTIGQWLKGRIYERKCDVSPDGKFFLYFALKGSFKSETKGAYTAISQSPYLKAISLFPEGSTWYGGGLWLGANEFWLSTSNGRGKPIRESAIVRRVQRSSLYTRISRRPTDIYSERLIRDGWTRCADIHSSVWNRVFAFEKILPGGWILAKLVHHATNAQRESPYWEEHELISPDRAIVLPQPHWEWAEWDRDRLVWASEGRLETGELSENGILGVSVIYDFNGMMFEPLVAPY